MQGATPVVHYFTREWVKMGHEVIVFHFIAKYPALMYWVGRRFQHRLNTRLGMLVPVKKPTDEDYEAEGVIIHRRCLRKLVPHSLYKKSQLERAIRIVSEEIAHSGIPDWFVGHWDNPPLELLDSFKRLFGKPTCLVLHDYSFNYEIKYGSEGVKMLENIDIIGFRSRVGQLKYEEKYGRPKYSFIASSGVSKLFLKNGENDSRRIKQPIHNFVFVGSLIERKYPSTVLAALSKVYPEGDFTMTYIGDGAEKEVIEEMHRKNGGLGKVRFIGRIPREDIIQYLKQSDVFVMVSREEVFGLVYLEAMALGLIPIGSKNEGIDGVIHNGDNGFLCEAGNEKELSGILSTIKNMSTEQLEELSKRAKETAREYSDEGVAKQYIDNLSIIQ